MLVTFSFFLGFLTSLIITDYQKHSYENPAAEHWVLLDSIPEDLFINFTAYISETNTTIIIDFTVTYNNSWLELVTADSVSTNVSLIQISLLTNNTLMHFIINENLSCFTYTFYTWLFCINFDDSIILTNCRIYYNVQFFQEVT